MLTKFRIFSSSSCSATSMRFFASTTSGSSFFISLGSAKPTIVLQSPAHWLHAFARRILTLPIMTRMITLTSSECSTKKMMSSNSCISS